MTHKTSRRPGPHLSPTPVGPGASPYLTGQEPFVIPERDEEFWLLFHDLDSFPGLELVEAALQCLLALDGDDDGCAAILEMQMHRRLFGPPRRVLA